MYAVGGTAAGLAMLLTFKSYTGAPMAVSTSNGRPRRPSGSHARRPKTGMADRSGPPDQATQTVQAAGWARTIVC